MIDVTATVDSPSSQSDPTICGNLDGFFVSPEQAVVSGWIVDRKLNDQPSTFGVFVDGVQVISALANTSRPDLVRFSRAGFLDLVQYFSCCCFFPLLAQVPGVTKSPFHGFAQALPAAALSTLLHGNHTMSVRALRPDGSQWELQSSPVCVNK